jgi:hypothetical protein
MSKVFMARLLDGGLGEDPVAAVVGGVMGGGD